MYTRSKVILSTIGATAERCVYIWKDPDQVSPKPLRLLWFQGVHYILIVLMGLILLRSKERVTP